jgi:putative restriction endonuclease
MIEKLAYPSLVASHIKPFIVSDIHEAYDVNNGLLLSRNMDILFDQGYISITPDYEIMVSDSIKDQFNNGKLYYAHHGEKLISLPLFRPFF